jgi:multiple sugar transport system substrate-binding protein
VGIALIPAADGADVPSASVTGGGGWGVLANSDSPELAVEFIQLLIDRDNQKLALELQQNMPVYTDMYSDPQILADNPQFEAFGPQFQYAKFRPVTPWYTEWSLRAQQEIQAALTGAKSSEQAVTDLATFTEEKTEEYSQ